MCKGSPCTCTLCVSVICVSACVFSISLTVPPPPGVELAGVRALNIWSSGRSCRTRVQRGRRWMQTVAWGGRRKPCKTSTNSGRPWTQRNQKRRIRGEAAKRRLYQGKGYEQKFKGMSYNSLHIRYVFLPLFTVLHCSTRQSTYMYMYM